MPARKANGSELLALRNVGPTSAAWLEAIGIRTRTDLEAMGAVMAYRILKHHQPGVTLHLLYALHGALHDVRWDQLTGEEKARLRQEAEAVLVVRIPGSVRT